jgi:hypothetical protein
MTCSVMMVYGIANSCLQGSWHHSCRHVVILLDLQRLVPKIYWSWLLVLLCTTTWQQVLAGMPVICWWCLGHL